jgi:low temperature requirement protein LtrA
LATPQSDEGLVRVILLSAMAAMLIASLAVPHAFGRYGQIFGIAYFVVRVLHVGCYAAVARPATTGRCSRWSCAWDRPSCGPPLCWFSPGR